jgi:hypothetical protein
MNMSATDVFCEKLTIVDHGRALSFLPHDCTTESTHTTETVHHGLVSVVFSCSLDHFPVTLAQCIAMHNILGNKEDNRRQ